MPDISIVVPVYKEEANIRPFLARAEADPGRYLVLDGRKEPGELSREIQSRVRDLLPDPVPMMAEEITGSFPAVRD